MDYYFFLQFLNIAVSQLEEVLIEALNRLDLKGERQPGLTGLWIDGIKVASIGIGCRRWITQHGLSLNVNCDLQGFSQIIPCGIKGQLMGSLHHWIPGLTVSEVQPLVKQSLEKHFGLLFNEGELNGI